MLLFKLTACILHLEEISFNQKGRDESCKMDNPSFAVLKTGNYSMVTLYGQRSRLVLGGCIRANMLITV